VHSIGLPHYVVVRSVDSPGALKKRVADGTLAGGVILIRHQIHVASMLIPILAPGATRSPGFDVVTQPSALLGEEWAETLAAGLSSRLYAGVLRPGTDAELASITITGQSVGHGAHALLNFFAPNISVVFLFIGSGLGMRSLFLERSNGTLVRIAAAPVRPIRIVAGKLVAILITGLATIAVMWAVTTFAFGADWGDPVGVLLMCLAVTLAMCGLGVFLTSLARDEKQAFGIVLLVGLVLSLLGGNLLPAGALPPLFQTLSLGTPNGWALVGFGRLALESEPASSVIAPILILLLIGAVFGGLALTRVRRMVEP
jgi:ABC-2 type transport system permease protein